MPYKSDKNGKIAKKFCNPTMNRLSAFLLILKI